MVRLSVEYEGADRIQRKLSRVSRKPLARVLKESSQHARKVAADGVGGIAARSIAVEAKPMSARVFSHMSEGRTLNIEAGRRPGQPVSPGVLEGWHRRVGYPGSVFELARLLRRRGVRGRFFIKAAIQSTQRELPKMLGKLGRQIEARFGE